MPFKIVFVCLGNICRSPLAHALLNHKREKLQIADKIVADSFATSNWEVGNPPDRRSVENARKNGFIYTHSAKQIAGKDIETVDLVLVMDNNNLKDVVALCKGNVELIKKIRPVADFDPEKELNEIPDPYHGKEEDFQKVFEVLDRTTTHLLQLFDKGLITAR